MVAVTKLIYEQSGNKKVGMIGYSQGTTNIFAGLALKYEEFFKEHAYKIAHFAPCTVREVAMDWWNVKKLDEGGVYVLGGPDEAWEYNK